MSASPCPARSTRATSIRRPSPRASPPRRRPAKLERPLRGAACSRFRDLRQPGRRHHRVPGRRLVDEAAAPGLGARTPGVIATLAGPRGLHRARRPCSRARTVSTRRSPAATTPPGSTRSARQPRPRRGSWRSSRSSPIRAARSPSPTWTARQRAARAAPRAARMTIAAIRCRTAAGPVPRLWEPLAAKHAPANGYAAKFSLPYLHRLDPGAGTGGAGGVHRRRRPRCRGAERGRPRALRARRQHRLSPAVRRGRRDPAGRRPRAARAPGPPARRPRCAADPRGAGDEVPWQRRRWRCRAERVERAIRSVHALAGGGSVADLVAAITP